MFGHFLNAAKPHTAGAERIVGKVLKERRDDVIVATKCGWIGWDRCRIRAPMANPRTRSVSPPRITISGPNTMVGDPIPSPTVKPFNDPSPTGELW